MSEQPLIKAIFFDGGDVLFRKIVNINEQIANYLGVGFDKYSSKEKELIKSDKEIQGAWKDIGTLEKEIEYFRMFNRKLLKSLGIVPSTETVEYMTMCHVKRCYVLVEGVREVLDYLSEKYQLGIISNCLVSRKHFELKDFKLEKYFSAVVLSREINIDKPHPDIFHYALKQLNKEPHECAFVDNKIENLQTALNIGFGKVVLFPRDDYKEKELLAIDSIKELQQIF
ncbi:MAG: HAD family hydrolase [Patescibacteria group bacterium]|nr:HAD family hydrolase [Patescibacteria group bacterium]